MKKRIGMIEKVDLTRVDGPIELRVITDVHAGAEAFHKKEYERDVAWALEKDNRFIITTGDLCETVTRNSVGNPEDRKMKIMDQMRYIVGSLTDVANEGKLLGMLGGNHEDRTKRDSFVDITALMAQQLGVKYFEDEMLMRLIISNITDKTKSWRYDLHAIHGAGGGATMGGQLNGARRGSGVYPMGDVFVSGHTHGYLGGKDSFYETTTTGAIIQRERLYVVCGTYLGKEGYATRRGYSPSIIGSPVIIFNNVEHDMKLVL